MPRKARTKAASGIYHVILRGINRQKIFQTAQDKNSFLLILRHYKQITGFELYAYCLMDNHVHLLIREQEEDLSKILHAICCRYAIWYNRRYDRVGHLFQNRFISRAVENEEYFLTVLHYIIQNPVTAGICQKPEQYFYSSAGEYVYGQTGITDVYFAFRMKGPDEIHRLLLSPSKTPDEVLNPGRMSDEDALKEIENMLNGRTTEYLHSLKTYQLARIISVLCEKGLSLRQISRLTGLGMGRIRYLKRTEQE